ncbi:M48 family metallopeptidase [Chrysiogenes arsenatis]|uniref:M48 family metallopeptidase n=1 Tax=Chrysiogenes arsenatis TaxID=309797 RepID=UPI00041E8C9F|nr:SprT family zinc-dependent metalloprotease [Chrysiogenes arsenatis]
MSAAPSVSFPLTLVRRPQSRRIRATVNHEGVRISAPSSCSDREIDAFCRRYQSELEAAWARASSASQTIDYTLGAAIPYLDQTLTIHLSQAATLRGCIAAQGDTLCVVTPLKYRGDLRSLILDWYHSEAQHHLHQRVLHYAAQMGLTFGHVRIKEQRTRWGSCSSQGNLNFNWKLITMPRHVVDYVVVHELAHLVHLDHSARFWKLVQQFAPQWQQAERYLKQFRVVF